MDRRSRRTGAGGQCCYLRSWGIAPLWRFWQASSTYLGTPPFSPRHHPVSAIAPLRCATAGRSALVSRPRNKVPFSPFVFSNDGVGPFGPNERFGSGVAVVKVGSGVAVVKVASDR